MAENRRNDNDNGRIVGAAIGIGALVGAVLALWTSLSRENEIQEQSQAVEQSIANTISSKNDFKIYVKRNIWRILETYGNPELVAEEWPAPADHIGRRDLVYHCDEIDYVLELKWIDYDGVNNLNRNRTNVINSNRKKRKEVQEQAERYGNVWLNQRCRSFNVMSMAIINSVDNNVEILKHMKLSRRTNSSMSIRYPVICRTME